MPYVQYYIGPIYPRGKQRMGLLGRSLGFFARYIKLIASPPSVSPILPIAIVGGAVGLGDIDDHLKGVCIS